jgi:uncharacterized protein YvpB
MVHSSAKLNIFASLCHSKTALPATIQHPAVVPAAQTNSAETSDHIGNDIKWVEGTIIGEETLDNFRTNTEAKSTDQESQVQGTSASGVEDPVESQRQEEKGEQVEKFVIGL